MPRLGRVVAESDSGLRDPREVQAVAVRPLSGAELRLLGVEERSCHQREAHKHGDAGTCLCLARGQQHPASPELLKCEQREQHQQLAEGVECARHQRDGHDREEDKEHERLGRRRRERSVPDRAADRDREVEGAEPVPVARVRGHRVSRSGDGRHAQSCGSVDRAQPSDPVLCEHVCSLTPRRRAASDGVRISGGNHARQRRAVAFEDHFAPRKLGDRFLHLDEGGLTLPLGFALKRGEYGGAHADQCDERGHGHGKLGPQGRRVVTAT
mmetsp:Transcript_26484/g.92104  ORF Transcript_26484/g.92104 Transcript_26484/m.92104 type:complete len:269 (-) Transcript_26484:1189-1995(-)